MTVAAPSGKGPAAPSGKGGGGGELIEGIPAADYKAIYQIAYDAPDHNGYLETSYAQYGSKGDAYMAVIENTGSEGIWETAVADWLKANS